MNSVTNAKSKISRLDLLTTVSSIALISFALGADPALADAYRKEPVVWIEMGLQDSRISDSSDSFALPVGSMVPPTGFTGPLVSGLNLPRSQTENGKITFVPSGSDWVFSASVTYGRSHGIGKAGQATPNLETSFVTYKFTYPLFPQSNILKTKHVPVTKSGFSTDVRDSESHLVVDFEAGKDVGLGLFGHGSTSTLSAGVRFAHFIQSRRLSNFQQTNGLHFQSSTFMTNFWPGYGTNRWVEWNSVRASDSATQSFAGVGPSISWDVSIPLTGNESHGGEFLFDWGMNAAMLFGKQRSKEEHKSSNALHCYSGQPRRIFNPNACGDPVVQYPPQTSQARSTKNVTVPNLGGFAAISYRIGGVKASVGYRGDFFFRAMDTGVAGQHAITQGFQGPYASVSVGIDD